jgi:hypothetical protein
MDIRRQYSVLVKARYPNGVSWIPLHRTLLLMDDSRISVIVVVMILHDLYFTSLRRRRGRPRIIRTQFQKNRSYTNVLREWYIDNQLSIPTFSIQTDIYVAETPHLIVHS